MILTRLLYCTNWLLCAVFLFLAGNAWHAFGHDLNIGIQDDEEHVEKCQYCTADLSSSACTNDIHFALASADSVISFSMADPKNVITNAYRFRAPPSRWHLMLAQSESKLLGGQHASFRS